MCTIEEIQCLEGHEDRAWSVAWSPSGEALASCSGDKTVRIWTRDGTTTDQWRCSAVLEGTHTRTVRSCAWSPDGRQLATASFDRTVAVWETQGGSWEQAAVLEGHESEVKGVAWNPNGSLIATCGRDKTVWVWEAQPGHDYEVVDVKHGHSQDVKTVIWHPSGEVLASASYDDTLKLWTECDDEWICVQTIGGSDSSHTSTVWDLAFDPTGNYLASCSDDCTLKIWRCQRGPGQSDVKCTLATNVTGFHERTIFSVDWSASGLIATGSADNSIRVFSVNESASEDGLGPRVSCQLECRREKAHPLDVNCVRWHPKDPTLFASAGDDGSVRLWRVNVNV